MRPLLHSVRAAALCLFAFPVLAESYSCAGSGPDWELEIGPARATFEFQRKNHFDIPQQSAAEGRDWPKAMTLIAEFDTAIVVLDRGDCNTHPIRAHVLTQRGQTPILLTGCCEVKE